MRGLCICALLRTPMKWSVIQSYAHVILHKKGKRRKATTPPFQECHCLRSCMRKQEVRSYLALKLFRQNPHLLKRRSLMIIIQCSLTNECSIAVIITLNLGWPDPAKAPNRGINMLPPARALGISTSSSLVLIFPLFSILISH